VWCQETALWSASRRYACRVDMVGLWNGIPSIIDFKTSTKPKREEWITDYYLQTTAYARAR
jgi:ATP-dependent exoDNAse (exonuclease V) beta subunit